jgi:hypothetical protein
MLPKAAQLVFLVAAVFACSCSQKSDENNMNTIAESYVKLVLKIGLYDPDYVDAYYGPEAWRPAKRDGEQARPFPFEELDQEISRLMVQLENINQEKFGELEKLRHAYLHKQLSSVKARIDFLSGKKMTFDEESKALYDAVAPTQNQEYFDQTLKELERALPGMGEVSQRLANFRKAFIIPKEKLDAVFQAAIAECRNRTLKHISLPENENFTIEYVTGKSWSAYNWYKGNYYSVIQVNTDLPIYIDQAIDYACHEGYPGHHVYNALLEKHLMREKNWLEVSVYPLFSPQSLIAEGSANFGIEVALPHSERVEFEREVLFPLAGLDPMKAEEYYQVLELRKRLDYADNEAARQYLDGKIDNATALNWLTKYSLMTRERAERRIRFIEQYRSYVINYNLGQDIVKHYIEKNGGTEDNLDKRWGLFYRLLSTPQTPTGLQ